MRAWGRSTPAALAPQAEQLPADADDEGQHHHQEEDPHEARTPRDGDPRAAYLLLDLDAKTAGFRRVPYDVAAAQAQIREAGLPEQLASRLGNGH